MKRMTRTLAAFAALSLASLALYTGCSVDSADTFYRDVSVNFSGYYTNPNGGSIVAQNSGSSIESLDLRQSGDSLQAVDNNSIVWKGTLGEVEGGSSAFELSGKTTRGVEATFSGTLSSSDGGTAASGTTANVTGTMQGTYIEPNRFSTFYATASIPGSDPATPEDPEDTDTDAVAISPTSAILATDNATQNFTASGGSSNYFWSLSSTNFGKMSSTTGKTVTYTRLAAGTNTITVSDSNETTLKASAVITQAAATP